jgi:hypothetical protein
MSQATTVNTSRGEMRAVLGEHDSFPRLCVGNATTSVRDADLEPDADLMVLRRGDQARAFVVDEMAYHHCAQGTLAGEPFVLMYCVVCDVGIGMTPVLDGQVLHMSAGGLSNGVVLALDDETGTYWDLTGEAVSGPLAGRHLDTWPIERTNVAAVLAHEPALALVRDTPTVFGTWWSRVVTSLTRDEEGYMPPFFVKTLAPSDERRSQLELGLGVVVDGEARFYPAAELQQLETAHLTDTLGTHALAIEKSNDGATWLARRPDGSRPFQVWGRWYGFAATFPECGVYPQAERVVGAPALEPSLLATTAPSAEQR